MTYASISYAEKNTYNETLYAKFYGERKNETKHSTYNVELLSGDYFFHLTPNQTPPKVLNFVLSVLDNLSMIVLKSF